MDLTDLVGDAGVEEDPLGRGGLAGVDVRHDADVADGVEVRGDVDCHCAQRSLGRGVVRAGHRGPAQQAPSDREGPLRPGKIKNKKFMLFNART